MHTALFTHSACLDHDTGEGHPECQERLRAVLRALEDEAFMFLDRREAPRVTREQLERVHPASYLDSLEAAMPQSGYATLDADTLVSPGSWEAALRSAGAVCAAIDAVLAGEARNAFCAVRPPGHHAEPDKAMGFCLFNNVAVGAAHARACGLRRVAIIDFDVHHGNGTQTYCQHDPSLLYLSTHQWPLYPGTGSAREHGDYDNVVNACLGPMSGSPEFRHAVQTKLLPRLDAFRPEILLISAGFDAHSRDPMAGLHLMEDDFAWVTEKLGEVAAKHAAGRMVSALEGGYDLRALANSAAVHVKVLMAV
ncbi:histone deacetylase family protein [Rhodospirillum centenum]|uniref:Histone deacetylase n=1 Tax=Rhodospirillum centenum (strain ATCC 51521 / SW) TaxID=414684 RepID=B6IRB2_RHOCS|nr:histone deacetylase family protein [Rhodospirillum centenum]ACI97998.1 histone deacetylase [Rhodospirillum centenum SW]